MKERKALHLDTDTAMAAVTRQLILLMIKYIAGMDPAFMQRHLQLMRGAADDLVKLRIWLLHILRFSDLCAVREHQIKQIQLTDIGAGTADADDGVHIIKPEQLIGIYADAGHPHA